MKLMRELTIGALALAAVGCATTPAAKPTVNVTGPDSSLIWSLTAEGSSRGIPIMARGASTKNADPTTSHTSTLVTGSPKSEKWVFGPWRRWRDWRRWWAAGSVSRSGLCHRAGTSGGGLREPTR